MGKILSRTIGAVLAVAIVGAAGFAFLKPYLQERFPGLFRSTIIDTFGVESNAPVGWIDLDAGPFRLKAPQGTLLRGDRGPGGTHGEVIHPAFRLAYTYAIGAEDPGWMRDLPGYRQDVVQIDSRRVVIYVATQPQSREPFYVSLVCKDVARWNGVSFSLEIHGGFATEGRRELAVRVLKTLKFQELPAWFRAKPISNP